MGRFGHPRAGSRPSARLPRAWLPRRAPAGCLPRTPRSTLPATALRLPGAPPPWRDARRCPRISRRRIERLRRPRGSSSTGSYGFLLVLLFYDLCRKLSLVQPDAYPLAGLALRRPLQRVPALVERDRVSAREPLEGRESVQARREALVAMAARGQRAAGQGLELLLQPGHLALEPVQPLARMLGLQPLAQRAQRLVPNGDPVVQEVFDPLPGAVQPQLPVADQPARIGDARAQLVQHALPSLELAAHRAGQPGAALREIRHQFVLHPGDQLCRRRGSGSAQVGAVVGDGDVDLVPDRADGGDRAPAESARDDLFVEGPEVLEAAAAPRHTPTAA